MVRRPVDPEEELRMMAQEVRGYVEAVLNSLVSNVPKAVVLCQVEKAKDEMLTQLYSSVSVGSVATPFNLNINDNGATMSPFLESLSSEPRRRNFPVIGNLKSLESIDLKGNGLSGQIPDEIGDCSALKILDVSLNYLYGDIPFSISKLKQLEQLIVKNNQLMGPIPSKLSQIPNLKKMDFADNQLSGEIPRLIYWNEVLKYLGLRNNFLVGTLSPDMCQLRGLWFFECEATTCQGPFLRILATVQAMQFWTYHTINLPERSPSILGFYKWLLFVTRKQANRKDT